MSDTTPIVDILGPLDIEGFDTAELDGAAVIDAFVIFRYQQPDWPTPRMAYVATTGMSDELRVGVVTVVLDRLRATTAANWIDDE